MAKEKSLKGRPRDSKGRLLPSGGKATSKPRKGAVKATSKPRKGAVKATSKATSKPRKGAQPGGIKGLFVRVSALESRVDNHGKALVEVVKVVEDHDRSIGYVMEVIRKNFGAGPQRKAG